MRLQATDWLIKAHPSPSTLFVQVTRYSSKDSGCRYWLWCVHNRLVMLKLITNPLVQSVLFYLVFSMLINFFVCRPWFRDQRPKAQLSNQRNRLWHWCSGNGRYNHACSNDATYTNRLTWDAFTIATAFASASTFFTNLVDVTNENQDDRKYADILLTHAIELYSAARNILPYSRYHKSVPTMKHVYSSSGEYTIGWPRCKLL